MKESTKLLNGLKEEHRMKVAADFAKEVNSDMTMLALVRYVGKEPKMEVCEIKEIKS